ncbi:MAG: PleD family two-component system response regulator [Candidatus Omnitrophota bacterium]
MAERILVVDDEPHTVKMVESRLRANGFDVITAQNGAEGLEKARAESPDLILLDIIMPEMNGHETLSKLKESEETKSIPVIMFTSKGQVEDVEKASYAGAVDYIVKPFDPIALLNKIRKALHGH